MVSVEEIAATRHGLLPSPRQHHMAIEIERKFVAAAAVLPFCRSARSSSRATSTLIRANTIRVRRAVSARS